MIPSTPGFCSTRLFQHGDGDFVGYEMPPIHVFACLLAQGGVVLQLFAEHIAGTDVEKAMVLNQFRGLRAFPRPGGGRRESNCTYQVGALVANIGKESFAPPRLTHFRRSEVGRGRGCREKVEEEQGYKTNNGPAFTECARRGHFSPRRISTARGYR